MLNFIFSKTNFRPAGVYALSFISNTLHNFSTGFFPIYRGRLELKSDTSILHKNGSFSKKTCCGLTALLLKTKIYFCRCNFVNKILVSFFCTDCSQYIELKIFQEIIVILEMELQIYGHLLKMSLYNMTNW